MIHFFDWVDWATQMLEELLAQGELLRRIVQLLESIWDKLP